VITKVGVHNLTSLTRLDLCGNAKITNGGIRRLTMLQSLNLWLNEIVDDAGIKYASFKFTSLFYYFFISFLF
jgi:hypothetical protein